MCWAIVDECSMSRWSMPIHAPMRHMMILALESLSGPESAVMDNATRLEQLFELHHELVWRFGLRMTGDPAEAEDLLQETFLRAAQNCQRLPEAPHSARAWLTQTLINLCRDRSRRMAVRRRYLAQTGSHPRPTGPDDPERLAASRQQVAGVVDALPARRRAVLVLRDLEGLPEERVAELLGMRRPTVRWHLAAARKALRRQLGPEETTND